MALEADAVFILASEQIAKVMEEYFIKRMFKRQVKIVDLKPASDGYAFSLQFVDDLKIKVNEQVSKRLSTDKQSVVTHKKQ